MNDVWSLFASKWQLDLKAVRTRVYRAPTPRERLQALWLLAKGWSAAELADALERDSHTIGDQLSHQTPARSLRLTALALLLVLISLLVLGPSVSVGGNREECQHLYHRRQPERPRRRPSTSVA